MKILIMVLFFSTMAFSQTYFEINPIVAFDDTVTWVSFNDRITVNIGSNVADWNVYGLKVNYTDPDSLGGLNHFKILITKRVRVNYSGQSITKTAQKNVTATKFNLIYTGEEQ